MPVGARYVDLEPGACRIIFCCSHWSSQGTSGAVKQGPGRTQDTRESLELHKCGLRGLGEAWTTNSRLNHFAVKSCRLVVSIRRLWEVLAGRWWQREAGEVQEGQG